MPRTRKQNLTVSLSPQTVQKAKVLPAKCSTSISGLVAKRGFHMGGNHSVDRDELHALISAAALKVRSQFFPRT